MKKNTYTSNPQGPNSLVLPLTAHQQVMHDAFTQYLKEAKGLKTPKHQTESLERRVNEFFRRCMGDPSFTSVYDCSDVAFLEEGWRQLRQNSDWFDYNKRHAGTLLTSLNHYIDFLKLDSTLQNTGNNKNVALPARRLLTTPEEYQEGKERYVHSVGYERSRDGRQKCLDHYGYICAICGMDFEKVYGDIGHEFIEVHHIIPVSQRGGAYKLDPIKDLRPLCSNCHSMIHRTNPVMTIDELKALYDNNRKNS